MPDFLTATLYAPHASFGSLAVGERRETERYPTRSMLTGLLGAALGIDRDNEAMQLALSQDYHFAVQIFASGRLLADYHTAQMPPRGRTRFATRRQELIGRELNTVRTNREYRTDFLAGLAISAKPPAPYPLEQIATAMRAPHYTLSFGRKSCVFGLPLGPQITEYSGPCEALLAVWQAGQEEKPIADIFRHLSAKPGIILLDTDQAPPGGSKTIEYVRDQPISRKRWQFTRRQVVILNSERSVL
jgi:CRISPR system Cascade subunit CasD